MATANHFWLDVVAGVGVALVALAIIHRRRVVSAVLRTHLVTTLKERLHRAGRGRSRPRSMVGPRRSRVTPNALTASGVLLCAISSVLVYFEYRNEILFFWPGARRLRASARSSTSSTVRSRA